MTFWNNSICKRNIRYFLFSILIVLTGCTSPSNKTYHIGLLSGSPIFDTTFDGFKSEMVKLGYVENENVTYIFRQSGADIDRMKEIAEEFAVHDVDLIVSTTNNGALVTRRIANDLKIPAVFTFVIAPEETGVIDADSTNITGVRNPLDAFVGKRIELLLLLNPDINRIFIPYDPQYPTVSVILDQLRQDAMSLNVELLEFWVEVPEDVVTYLDNIQEVDFDAIIIFPDLTVQQPLAWGAILDFANEHKLPIAANTPGQVESGALFSYLVDNESTGRQAAHLASQILNGTDISDVPVETSDVFLMFNCDSTLFLGFNVPDSILDEIDIFVGDGKCGDEK